MQRGLCPEDLNRQKLLGARELWIGSISHLCLNIGAIFYAEPWQMVYVIRVRVLDYSKVPYVVKYSISQS